MVIIRKEIKKKENPCYFVYIKSPRSIKCITLSFDNWSLTLGELIIQYNTTCHFYFSNVEQKRSTEECSET